MSIPSGFRGFHHEEEHVAVEIGHIEIAQAAALVRRRLENARAALLQVCMPAIRFAVGYDWILGGLICAPPGRNLTNDQFGQFIDRAQVR